MSNNIPIFAYPGGAKVTVIDPNATYKWIDQLGGGILPGPIEHGTLRPDGKPAHGGVLTTNNGNTIIEYHYCR